MTGPQLRYPLNALVSYHYFKTADLSLLTAGGLRLIGDSGAFSAATQGATITLPEFAEWAGGWRDHLAWVASLDVIGDAAATWRNYRQLRDKYGLEVVPTVHAGAPRKTLDRYVAEGIDFIGLGGLVPHRGRPKATLPWLVDVMRYARDKHPAVRFHGWGVTSPSLTQALPWYSVDSSSIGQSYRYARVALFDPTRGRWRQIALDGRAPLEHADFLRHHYGTRARDVLDSSPANRRLLIRMTARSYQLVEDWLRRRHGAITAPRYGLRDRERGVHLPAADTAMFNHQLLARTGPNMHAADGALHNLKMLTTGGTE